MNDPHLEVFGQLFPSRITLQRFPLRTLPGFCARREIALVEFRRNTSSAASTRLRLVHQYRHCHLVEPGP